MREPAIAFIWAKITGYTSIVFFKLSELERISDKFVSDAKYGDRNSLLKTLVHRPQNEEVHSRTQKGANFIRFCAVGHHIG